MEKQITIHEYETELKKHRFSFTVSASDAAAMIKSINAERYLQRVAANGGEPYRMLYAQYMNKAIKTLVTRPVMDNGIWIGPAEETKTFIQKPAPRTVNRTDMSLTDFKKALADFNWDWAKTCRRDVYEGGLARKNELQNIANTKGQAFKQAWNEALAAHQGKEGRLQIAQRSNRRPSLLQRAH